MNVFNRGADIITWKRVQDKSQKKLWTIKIFHLKGKNYPDDLETFQVVWKLSIRSGNFQSILEYIEIFNTLQARECKQKVKRPDNFKI